MQVENKVNIILDAIGKVKGQDIIVYDFTSINPFIDRVIICSANNMRQVYAIAQMIKEKCRENNIPVKMEGNQDSRWILMDADEVIVHVFLDDEREVYKLERLYGDLPRLEGCYDL
ncbi:MAG: ribosome silencing factor [Erysipelotrichia bacterium]|nr:ribosome silencing factor [Erysipelotrichia bacterium]NCC54282.1 ribosome silencing factor [Erysipelotrichia bacterium]